MLILPAKEKMLKKKNISAKEAKETLEKGAKNVSEDDLDEVVKKADKIEDTFKSHGPLNRFIQDVTLMISLAKDYAKGNYREVPFWTIAAIVAALLYVLNPIDIIPDFIPVVGYLDDAAVVGACLLMVEQDLKKYSEWKSKQ
jgi:uncharacterized membrane protein YkvA (DUF1232 family)